MNKRYVPNALTLCNLICGCVAAGAGFHALYPVAFLFILAGAVFDFFDGYSARLLRVPSPMGIELDSLADVVTFGVAPGAMLFSLYAEVRYPEVLNTETGHMLMPFLAFLLPAFSAYRLAKFNLDQRQRSSFIGMPTPACAIFWAALITGCGRYLMGPMFNVAFLLAFQLMFCFLLVCEIPMFSMKFHGYGLKEEGNAVRYAYLAVCAVLLLSAFVFAPESPSTAGGEGLRWMLWGGGMMYFARAVAACMGLYVVVNLLLLLRGRKH